MFINLITGGGVSRDEAPLAPASPGLPAGEQSASSLTLLFCLSHTRVLLPFKQPTFRRQNHKITSYCVFETCN